MIKKGLCTTCCIYTPVLWKSVFLKCCMSVSNCTFLLRDCTFLLRDPLVPWLRSFKQTWTFTLFTNGVSKLREKASCRNCISCTDPSSEPEQVDKLLRWKRGGASLWVVGCAGVISTLPGKDVAVPAQLQCVTILLLPWVTPYELEVHLLPIQLSFVR